MTTRDDGFTFEGPPEGKPYLGDAHVVQGLISQFAQDVMAQYHEFLTGSEDGKSAQAKIDAMVQEYGGIFMGRDDRYTAAPWQNPVRMGGKLRYAVDSIMGDDDPGEGYFKFLALQCIKASRALNDGMSPAEAGPRLKEILDDAVDRFLGVV